MYMRIITVTLDKPHWKNVVTNKRTKGSRVKRAADEFLKRSIKSHAKNDKISIPGILNQNNTTQ